MKKIALYKIDKGRALSLIDQYVASSREQAYIDISLYIDYRYNGYSTFELAVREHMDRATVYRRIKKVDHYIQSMCTAELDGDIK